MYNLTNPQKSIWLTEQFYKNTPMENITGCVTVLEKLNLKALQKAINLFVEKNDSFRLKFILKDDNVFQYLSSFSEFEIENVLVKTNHDIKKLENQMSNTVFEVLDNLLFSFKTFTFPDGHGGYILTAHHLIYDAWTASLVGTEIINYYEKIINAENLDDISNPSYIDYIVSEQEYLKSEKFKKDKEFWNGIFNSIPEIATIPSINSNSQELSCKSKRKQFIIPEETISLINKFCKENKASIFNFFIAIFSLYISRVSSLNDFTIGTPILNRGNFKEKQTTGMFISNIPFRVSVNNDISFAQFLSNISMDFLKIFRHQKYPYQYLLEDLRKQDSSLPNLYNVALSYQNARTNAQTSSVKYESEWVETNYIADDMDIHIYDMNDTGNINIAYDYLTSKYSIDDICFIHARILHIINQILENNEINLKDIEIVTPDEKKKLLYTFNNTQMDYPKDKTISQLFEEQVEKTPDNIAVVFGDQQLTYRELNERANSLANYLLQLNISKNTVIPVLLNRSIDLIVSMLAIIKSGNIYLPISPDYPIDRIKYILQDSSSKYLLTNTQNNLLELDFIKTIKIDEITYSSFDKNNLNINSTPSDVLYIIYTSGSTGNPKGVAVMHQNLNNFIHCFNKLFKNISFSDKLLASTHICFDVSIFEFFISLLNGLTLCLYQENTITNIFEFCDSIINNDITMLYIPPNLLNEVYQILSKKNYSKINKILLGVEPINYDVAKQYYNLNPDCNIINAYGPTETTICATAYEVSFNNTNNYKIIPIGKPLYNLNLFILDKTLNLVPPGISGELYITGDNVSKGYIFNTILSKKAFVKIPFSKSISYKTGDIVKWNNDGTISFVGRNDSQIKINGHRIELGEIEKVVYLYPNIEKCIAIYNDKKLNVYLTSKSTININDLRDFLQSKLPLYFIPNYIIQIDKFTLTKNGKIDTKNLLKFKSAPSNYEKAHTKTQEDLVAIFQKVLNMPQVGINDSFFDLGGDSLASIKIQIEAYNKGLNISAQDIFKNPTIKLLSNFIDSSSSSIFLEKIDRINNKQFYITSSAQRRIYFASTISGETSILYNTPGGVIFDKPLITEKLESCINKLINRHESLRTKFDVKDNEIVQTVVEKINFKLEVLEKAIDFSSLNDEFNNFIKPFDLSKAPLFRLKYINLSDGNSALFIDMHHIISDGTSLTIFVEELCKLYNEEELTPLNITYKDFANYENTKLKNGSFKEAEDFWVNQFKDDIPVLNMPTTYSRPSVKAYSGSKIHSKIDFETTKKINTLSKKLGITPYMLLLSVYYILLSKYTAQEDIIVGTPVVGRDTPELYNIIGMFVNSLPIRAKIDFTLSFKEFLNNIKDICLKDFKYQDYPFDELVDKLNIPRDTSRTPLFDTMFIYQNNGIPQINFKDIKSRYYIPDTNISKFDLSLEIIPIDNELQLSFEYCTKLFEKSFIENFANHYSNILHVVLDNLDIKLSSIDMLSEKERNTILYDFNNTKMDYPKEKTISQLFEEQVERTPDNIAVVFEDKKLTYKELNEKSNSLAHYLRNSGISRNDIVGIMVNRSLEMIVSILAVLKSGACYIPIDPDYPQDRITYMLDNSNSKYLLTFKYLDDKVSFDNKIFVELSSALYNEDKTNLENINSPEDLAYIIYTSGSTGMPKGVMLKHNSITNLASYLNNYIEFFIHNNIQKNIVSVTTISFDIFIFETLICLQRGLKIIVANEEEQHIPSKLFDLIKKENAEIMQMTPSRMQIFLDNIDTASLQPLKYIILAGEALPDALRSKLLASEIQKIYNGYGPSETTVFSTFTDVTDLKKVNIGKPLYNTQTYILDKNMHVCPINVPGELYISGDGVGLGYLNNALLTQNSYLNNPFLQNSIMYKTGDLCVLSKDHEIQYLGRVDNQIKIRGLRIELGEIENKIQSFPNIKKVCVIKQTINNRDFLSAYFTQTKRINISNLREYLSNSLPKYMVPTYFTVIDDFPYTPNGKIDRKALPIPSEILNGSHKKDYVPAKTDLEKSFVKIWEDVLNISPIGITDNFFELGGDSILAMNLNIELRKICDSVTYSDIFKFPTISALIKKITSENENYDFNYMEKNYDKYTSLLEREKIPSIFNLKHCNVGNILLTGATGFLGAHILAEFINKEKGNVYCIVREEPGLTAQAKLHQKLNYYFGNKYDKLIGKRIFAITGNINNIGFGLNQEDLLNLANNISTIINTAARVAHYGNYKDFYNSNVKSVQYLIDFCKSFDKKLYHISTLSVSGNSFDSTIIQQNTEDLKYFTEKSLYIGQSLENVYVRSKFEAECLILDAILDGLDAHILRVGNLMPRAKDGIFQENISENAFITRIAEFIKIGVVPDSLLEEYLEFTPVDTISTAIIKSITHPSKDCLILHLFNHNHVYINKCIKYFKLVNPDLKIVTEEDFKKHVKKLLKNKNSKNNINLLINDMDKNLNLMYKSNIIVKSDFTIKYLSKIGFNWHKISEKYIFRFLDLIRKVL